MKCHTLNVKWLLVFLWSCYFHTLKYLLQQFSYYKVTFHSFSISHKQDYSSTLSSFIIATPLLHHIIICTRTTSDPTLHTLNNILTYRHITNTQAGLILQLLLCLTAEETFKKKSIYIFFDKQNVDLIFSWSIENFQLIIILFEQDK